jgi:hypothetical protein
VNTNEKLMSRESQADHPGEQGISAVALKAKKDFIEPDISVPVDVLEATTYFQGVESGVTLP